MRIFQALLKQSENGKLRKGTIRDMATLFGLCTKTISRIWRRGKKLGNNDSAYDVSTRFAGRAVRKRVQIDCSRVADIPLRRQKTICSLAHAMDVPKSTLHQRIKEGVLRRHSNALKPNFTPVNKIKRLHFCLSKLHPQGHLTNPLFEDMDVVHVDKK